MVKTLVMKGQPGFGPVLLTMHKDQHAPSYLSYQFGNLIQFIIPTALPTLLCFVLMIVQVFHLSKKNANRALLQVNSAEERAKEDNSSTTKASSTIFLLTVIYVSTAAVSILTWLVVDGREGYFSSKTKYEALRQDKRMTMPWSDLTAIYFSLSTCPLICSTLTPLTLLLRGTGTAFNSLRQFFSRLSGTRVTMI